MTGCSPLTKDEIKKIAENLKPVHKAIFYLGLTTGLRIGEILSLNIKDVYIHGTLKIRSSIKRSNTKKRVEGKSFNIIEPAYTAISEYLKTRTHIKPDQPLFQSQKRTRLSTRGYLKVLKKASENAQIDGKIGTHSMRKTFAKNVYEQVDGDYMKVKLVLGHKSVSSTESYLQFITVDDINSKLDFSYL